VSLFGDVEQPAAMLQLAVADPASLEDRLAWEQELLGIFVSPHPLTTAEEALRECGAIKAGSLGVDQDGQKVRGAGLIRGLRSFSTKAGQPMATFQLADLQSAVEVVVFSRTYEQVSKALMDNALVLVDAKVDASDGRLRLVADDVLTLDDARNKPAPTNNTARRNGGPSSVSAGQDGPYSQDSASAGTPEQSARLIIEIARTENRSADLQVIERVYEMLQRFPGSNEVELHVRHGERVVQLPLPNKCTRICGQLQSECG